MKKWIIFAAMAALAAGLAGCGGTAASPAEATSQEALPVQTAPVEAQTAEAAPDEGPEDAGTPESTDLGFTSLELTVSEGTLYIQAGDAFSLTRNDSDADYEIEDGVLRCSVNHTGKTVLTLPSEGTYDTLCLTVGEGHVYGEGGLMFQSLELEVGRGEVTLEGFTVEDSAVSVRQGAAILSCDLGCSIAADCREGRPSLALPLHQSDYDYTVELSGGGSVRFGNENYHGLSASKSVDNGAERSIAVSCTRGDVSVAFDK